MPAGADIKEMRDNWTSHVRDDMIFLIYADLIRGLSRRPSVDQKRSRAPVGRSALPTPWVTCGRCSPSSQGACEPRPASFASQSLEAKIGNHERGGAPG